jgi:paraquat-inducible protein A
VTQALTAAQASLVSCHACDALAPAARGEQPPCARCGAPMHSRKPDSLTQSSALVMAAAIFYVPANMLPIMTVKSFGKGEPSTILGGIQELIASGMWSLALLVLFASILVPMLKIVSLTFLIWSVRTNSRWRPRDRTVLYRVVEYIGRWSMIDMFMTSILVALVKLGTVATIEAGAGATFFAAVVVITIVAAARFDPRLIWDRVEEGR